MLSIGIKRNYNICVLFLCKFKSSLECSSLAEVTQMAQINYFKILEYR